MTLVELLEPTTLLPDSWSTVIGCEREGDVCKSVKVHFLYPESRPSKEGNAFLLESGAAVSVKEDRITVEATTIDKTPSSEKTKQLQESFERYYRNSYQGHSVCNAYEKNPQTTIIDTVVFGGEFERRKKSVHLIFPSAVLLKSRFVINLSEPSEVSVKGSLQLLHQSQSTEPDACGSMCYRGSFEFTCADDDCSLIAAIQEAENNFVDSFQSYLVATIQDRSKKIRKFLPVTKSKINWNAALAKREKEPKE